MTRYLLDVTRNPTATTFEEAARLNPDDHPGELDAGRWIPVTKNTWRHGRIVANVCVLLKLYVRQHGGFSIAAGDPGTKLAHDPDILRGPDVAVIRAGREPTGRGAAGWLEGSPDFVVEVLGDDDTTRSLLPKVKEYLAAGAKLVWVVDADAELVTIFSADGSEREIRDGTIDGGQALPGFQCRVAELFE